METIKNDMRLKMASEREATKEAEKAKQKVARLISDLDVSKVKIGDLEARLEASETMRMEQRARMKVVLDRTAKLEEELKKKVASEEALSSEVQDLKDEAALVRVVARAALMRRVVAGTLSVGMASEELEVFRGLMGSDDLLDADDLKDLEEESGEKPMEAVGGEEETLDKAASGSNPAASVNEDAPPKVVGPTELVGGSTLIVGSKGAVEDVTPPS